MNPQTKNIPTGAVRPGGSFHFPEAGEDGSGREAGHKPLKIDPVQHSIQMTGGELATVYAWRQTLAAESTATVPAGKVAAGHIRTPALPTVEQVVRMPPRGGEAKSIGQLMEPIRRIIAHPDRNRLMAQFCKLHW